MSCKISVAASQSSRPEGTAKPCWQTTVTHVLSACVFAAFLLYYGLGSFRWGWGGDFQMYCAGVSRLYTSFLHPMHEAMNVPGTQSTVYTPYLVAVAALGKLACLTPYQALQVAGVFNISAFAAAVAYFTSRHSLHGHWALPAACFLLVTLCLRWLRFGWSSETSLTSLQYLQAYPSTLGWALALSAFALARDLQSAKNRRSQICLIALLALLFAFLLLTHVLTASWVIGIVCLYALVASVQHRSCLLLAQLSVALLLALPLVALWPYAPFFARASLSKLEEGSLFGSQPWKDFPNLYALAAPAALYCAIRLRRHGFWILGHVATVGALGLWRHWGISFGNRYTFFAAFFAQFLVAEVMALGVRAGLGILPELRRARRWPGLDRPLLVLILAGICVAWLPSPMFQQITAKDPGFSRLPGPLQLWAEPSPHDAYYARFSDLAPYIQQNDLVLMPLARATFDLASITGASVISSPNALAVPSRGERERDVTSFFDVQTSALQRAAILQRYGASKVVIFPEHFGLEKSLEAVLGPPLQRTDAAAIWGL